MAWVSMAALETWSLVFNDDGTAERSIRMNSKVFTHIQMDNDSKHTKRAT